MSRKISVALIGLMLLIVSMVPTLAATYQAVGHDQSGYTVLVIPVIIMIVYLLLAGAIAIAVLIWLFNHHMWPFS